MVFRAGSCAMRAARSTPAGLGRHFRLERAFVVRATAEEQGVWCLLLAIHPRTLSRSLTLIRILP